MVTSFVIIAAQLACTAPHAVTPLFATLTKSAQLSENTSTLSPLLAALTRSVRSNSFICRSYTKSPGVWGSRGLRRPCRRFSSSPILRQSPRLRTPIPTSHVTPSSARDLLLLHSSLFTRHSSLVYPSGSPRMATPPSHSLHSRCSFLQFSALFCTAQKLISFCFSTFRALCQKHPGCTHTHPRRLHRKQSNGAPLPTTHCSLLTIHFPRSQHGILSLS
jgi:hypothetical protein